MLQEGGNVSKRLLIKAASAAVVITLLLPLAIAGAHDSSVKPRITIGKLPRGVVDSGDRVVVHGDIKGKTLCRQQRVVSLFAVDPGANSLLETDRSDGDGEFRFVLRPRNDMTVYARVGRLADRNYNHRHVCRPRSSERLDINVT
jgi:hypothetical protein